jgi:sigma-E factor negative regulatory protein RseC
MQSSVCVEQQGIIEEITGKTIKVRIHPDALCGKCSARGICILSDESGKVIEAEDVSNNVKTGDRVKVIISRSMGNKAVYLGYLIPFILLISSLIVLNAFKLKEWLSGSLSIIIVLSYYIVLYLFRERLKRTFTFTIRKMD